MLKTEFSIANPLDKKTPVPDFCRDTCYNNFKSSSGEGEIYVKHSNTRLLVIKKESDVTSLQVNSSQITFWSDVWHDENSNVVDPKILSLSLQNNLLTSFQIEEQRSNLTELDLSSNPGLEKIYLPLCDRLKVLKLNKLTKLREVIVRNGSNPVLNKLEMRYSNIPQGLLSSLTFSIVPGVIDFTGSVLDLNESDREVLDFLKYFRYTLRLPLQRY